MIGLDYSNERYVRSYVRDTEEYLLLPWEARGLYWELRRKVDRSGLLKVRNGAASVVLLIRWPADVVERALDALLASGFVLEDDRGYLMPEFLPSEEAKQSVAQRARESRARRVDRGVTSSSHDDVDVDDLETTRDDVDSNRDEQPVTRAVLQRNVTTPPRDAPKTSLRACRAVPTVEEERSTRFAIASRVFAFMEQERKAIDPQARDTARINCEDKIVRLLAMGNTEDDLLHVVKVYSHEARQQPSDQLRWFQGATMWQPDNVDRAKSRKVDATRQSAGDGLRAGGGATVRPADADERAQARLAELDAEAEARRRQGPRRATPIVATPEASGPRPPRAGGDR
jgi:hypothetical protein